MNITELEQIISHYIPTRRGRDMVMSAIKDHMETEGLHTEFVDELERMRSLYKNGRIGLSEELRDELAEKLDDIRIN